MLSLYLAGLIPGAGHAQTSPGYLETLQDEAAGLNLDKNTETEAKPAGLPPTSNPLTVQQDHSGAIKEFVSGLSIEQFEELLKHNYLGSYLFYKRLGPRDQGEVYRFYQLNPDPNLIREKILQVKKNL